MTDRTLLSLIKSSLDCTGKRLHGPVYLYLFVYVEPIAQDRIRKKETALARRADASISLRPKLSYDSMRASPSKLTFATE